MKSSFAIDLLLEKVILILLNVIIVRRDIGAGHAGDV